MILLIYYNGQTICTGKEEGYILSNLGHLDQIVSIAVHPDNDEIVATTG